MTFYNNLSPEISCALSAVNIFPFFLFLMIHFFFAWKMRLSLCSLLLSVLLHCVNSMPSGFDVTQVNVEILNSSGISGNWRLTGQAPTCDTSRSCGVWSQSDKKSGMYYLTNSAGLSRGWAETVADVSNLNGFNNSSPYYGGVRILNFLSDEGRNVGGINIWPSSNGTGLSGYIMTNWRHNKDTEFAIPTEGFHRYTLGYDNKTSTISVYVDDFLATSKTFDSLNGTYALRVFCGYDAGSNVIEHGTGALYAKECSFNRPTVKTVYVDAAKGLDTNDGLTKNTPVKTMQTASGMAMKGTTIYVADGIYRESFTLPSGTEKEPVALIGTGDNVYISGSVPASDFIWKKDPKTNIWSANVSEIIKQAPLIATYRDKKTNEFVRCYQARTPNYRVDTPFKFTEFWNMARGGSKIMDCFGEKDCNDTSVSTRMLADEVFKTMTTLSEQNFLQQTAKVDTTNTSVLLKNITRPAELLQLRRISIMWAVSLLLECIPCTMLRKAFYD